MQLTQISVDGAVAELLIRRPQAANALSADLVEELLQRLQELAARSDVHVVVLAGDGRHFCSGMDLAEASVGTPDEVAAAAARLVDLCQAVQNHACPVIARVHGAVSAAGLQLALSCDLVYADELATFATPGSRVGMWCMTPMVPLVRTIGQKLAAEMLLLGLPVTAARAQALGLVNGVFPTDALRSQVQEIALTLASRPPQVVALGRQALRQQQPANIEGAYAVALEGVRANAALPDAQEGMRAFLEKRSPEWRHRG